MARSVTPTWLLFMSNSSIPVPFAGKKMQLRCPEVFSSVQCQRQGTYKQVPRGNGFCLNESLQTLWTTRSHRGKGHCGSTAFLSACSARQLAAQHLHELGRTWGLLPHGELPISSASLLCSLSSKVRFSCRLKELNLSTSLGAACLNSRHEQWSQHTH